MQPAGSSYARPTGPEEKRGCRKANVPHLRAALTLLHLVAITLMALPAPIGADRTSNYEGPEAEAQLAQIVDALDRVGIRATKEDVVDLSLAVARPVMAARRAVLTPFKPYYSLAGTRQGYRMFSGTSRYQNRLQVEVRDQGEWRTLYLMGDPDARWRGATFNHELTRSMLYRYTERRYRKRWNAVADWIAAEAAADHPTVDRVRVSVQHGPIQTAAEARSGTVPETRRRRKRTLVVEQ